MFIVRILSKHGTRCGEETQIRKTDYRVVNSMGEEQEVDEACGGYCAGQ